jgi:hypothetical protein
VSSLQQCIDGRNRIVAGETDAPTLLNGYLDACFIGNLPNGAPPSANCLGTGQPGGVECSVGAYSAAAGGLVPIYNVLLTVSSSGSVQVDSVEPA